MTDSSSNDASVSRSSDAQEGHLGYILAAVFSADGRRLYYADGAEGYVNVCDAESGALLARWRPHVGPITELRRSHDGKQLLSASFDGSVGVCDADDGRLIRRLTRHGSGVHSLDVSQTHVAAGGFDGTVRVWDSQNGVPLNTIEAHADAVTCVAFVSPDRIISGSRDHTLRLWDLESGECARVMEGHHHWVTKLAAIPDSRQLLSAGEDGICNLWDWERGEVIWSGRIRSPIWALGLAPNGEFAITGSIVTRWELSSGGSRVLDRVDAGRAIAISPDNTVAACGNDRGGIAFYDLERDEVVRTLAGAGEGCLAAAADGGKHIATGHQNGSLVLHGPGGERRTLDDAHTFMAYALCRVGDKGFASGGFDGVVRLWDFSSGELVQRFDHGGRFVFSVSASADGSLLFSAGSDAWCLWDLNSKQQTVRVDPVGSGGHTHADLARDASLIVCAGEDDVVRVWQPDGTLSDTVSHPCGQVADVCLLPDNRGVLLADARGRVSLLDLESHECERLHEEHEDWIRSVQVTPDGRYVVSSSQNFICRVYDLEARQLCALESLNTPIPAAAIDANGEIVAVSARGEILRIDSVGAASGRD